MLILLNRISSRLNTISLFHYIRMYELNVELKYQRRSIRLKEYDYTMPGGYFITICTQNRDCLFGDFVRTGNQLNCTGCTGDRPVAPTVAPTGPPSESIGALMAGYKSAVTKRINLLRRTLGYPVWQRNYYEHIIRNDKELNQIRQYIILNPVNWEKDTEFIPL